MLDNAMWVHQRAVDSGILSGDNSGRVTAVHHQGIADVLAGLGWNAGRKKPTLSTEAWWTPPPTSTNQGDITNKQKVLSHLTLTYQGKEGIKSLLSTIRKHHKDKVVPCQRDNGRDKHKYWINDWSPFRLKCPSCGHMLYETEAFAWFAELVDKGHVPASAFNLTLSPLSPQRLPVSVPFPDPEQ